VAGPGFDDFAYSEVEEDDIPANTNDLVAQGSCPDGQTIVSAYAFWNAHNEAIQLVIGFVDPTTMGVQAWSTGVDDVDDVILDFSCATLPLAPRPARHMLSSLK
jgi:hypothetical protein